MHFNKLYFLSPVHMSDNSPGSESSLNGRLLAFPPPFTATSSTMTPPMTMTMTVSLSRALARDDDDSRLAFRMLSERTYPARRKFEA